MCGTTHDKIELVGHRGRSPEALSPEDTTGNCDVQQLWNFSEFPKFVCVCDLFLYACLSLCVLVSMGYMCLCGYGFIACGYVFW